MTSSPVSGSALRRRYQLPEDNQALLSECTVTYFRASGPGGQHRNKTMSAVRLYHRPSGIVVIGRRERSQRRNREDALLRLCRKLTKLLKKPKRRKKTKPSKAATEKRLQEKKQRGRLKQERSPKNWE